MKFKRNRLFIVLLCLFVCFTGFVFKASDSAGDLCTPNECTDCHIASLCSSEGFYLRQVDSSVEKHELGSADVAVVLKNNPNPLFPPPPDPDLLPRLVLGGALYCTDCHEDHNTPTPNVFQLKNNVNNTPVEVPITQLDPGVCTLGAAGNVGNKALGWFCRTCHKDDANFGARNPADKNKWNYAHHETGGGVDYPYLDTRCYFCHKSGSAEPINCDCCHYHGSMTTDYGTSYPCYVDPYVCANRTPFDRRTF